MRWLLRAWMVCRLSIRMATLTALFAIALPSPTVHAATYTVAVTTSADTLNDCSTTGAGTCSLRDAVRFANSKTSTDTTTITLPAGTYYLTRTGAGEDDALTGDLDIKANVAISGAGVGVTVIDGAGQAAPSAADRIFQVFAGYTVSVTGLTLRNGLEYWDAMGGTIRNAGNLALTNVAFSGNMASGQRVGTRSFVFTSNGPGFGGALANDPGGSVTITGTTFTGNTAQGGFGNNIPGGGPHSIGSGYGGSGGAIVNDGTMTISASTFSANTTTGGGGADTLAGADATGGAILNTGTLTITTSTFASNTSTAATGRPGGLGTGGAITSTGTLTVTRSTFAGNNAIGGRGLDTNNTPMGGGNGGNGLGGAILINSGAATILANDTFVSNSATGGIGGAGCGNTGLCPGDGSGGGGYGGALFDVAGNVNMGNVTIAGNAAVGAVGGSTNGPGGPTMGPPGAAAGAALNSNSAPLKLANTIVSGNVATRGDGSSAPNNCQGSITDLGNDLEYNPTTTCGFTNAAQHGDPQLGPLADNGGPTQTIALGTNSAASGTGSTFICSVPYVNGVDQRGMPRLPAICSIGAYQPQITAAPPARPPPLGGPPALPTPGPLPQPR